MWRKRAMIWVVYNFIDKIHNKLITVIHLEQRKITTKIIKMISHSMVRYFSLVSTNYDKSRNDINMYN